MLSYFLKTATFFVFFAFLTPLFADSSKNDSIVVWRIEPKSGVSDKEADTISGMVTAEVGRASGRKTVGENEMKALIVGEEMKMSCGAEDTACVAEIGAALGAPESITGTISKMGDYWILTLQRLNVRKVEVISRYENRIKGDVNLLIETIPSAVKELFGIKSTENKSGEEEKGTSVEKPLKKLTVLGRSGIGLIAGGGAVLMLGGISQWKTGVEKEKYENGDTYGDKSDYNAWKYTSIISYSVGGVALAAGIALLITDIMIDNPVKTSIAPLPGGAHISISWRW